MPENPFKPQTRIEQSDSVANEKLVASILSAEDAAQYATLNQNVAESLSEEITNTSLNEEEQGGINEAKLVTPEKIMALLKESGSPAILDTFFEGGVVSIHTTPELREVLQNFESAALAYIAADNGSPSHVARELKRMPLLPLQIDHFKAIILSYKIDPNIQVTFDTILADMDQMDLRPATFAELIALGIVKPEFNKRNEILIALGTSAPVIRYSRNVPTLGWGGNMRLLNWGRWRGEIDARSRFLCVCK